MAEGYQQFLDFDWSDEGWVEYLKNLYPPPDGKKVLKFKKKWYKKNIDPSFDDSYEPPQPAPSMPERSSEAAGGRAGAASSPGFGSSPGVGSLPDARLISECSDGSRWRKLGRKATICFGVYCIAIVFAIGAMANVFPAYQALVVLVAAFILEIFAKYGLKLSSTYMQSVLLDDVGVMPMMALTLLTPGLHPWIRLLALVSPFVTAVLSLSQICKAHGRLPKKIRDFFSPLADMAARYKVMQVRAHVEVFLGLTLFAGGLTMRAAPISVLLFWNFMMMRYMMSPWTQASFRRLDNTLKPVLSKIPGVSYLYQRLKDLLYGFVDPNSRRAGKLCTIL